MHTLKESLIKDALEFLGKKQKYKSCGRNSAIFALLWKSNKKGSFQGIIRSFFIVFDKSNGFLISVSMRFF